LEHREQLLRMAETWEAMADMGEPILADDPDRTFDPLT